jgi:hypothetical protein
MEGFIKNRLASGWIHFGVRNRSVCSDVDDANASALQVLCTRCGRNNRSRRKYRSLRAPGTEGFSDSCANAEAKPLAMTIVTSKARIYT